MSLHEKCVLVDLTITSLTTSRTDPRITRDVLFRTAAGGSEAGRWVSRLWPKEALEPISRHDSATRKIHQQMTLPWLDNSKRILPTGKVQDYMAAVRQRRPEREKLIREHFLDRFDHWLREAAVLRGDSFRPTDYPGPEEAASAFAFRVEAEPVPHRDDFRVALAATDLGEMQATLESRLAAAARIARNDLLQRISEPLARLVERLSASEPKFKDSLIGNIRDIARAIPALNVTADPGIETVRQRIEAALAGLDPAILRESSSDRTRAAAQANRILATMAPWLEEIPAAAV